MANEANLVRSDTRGAELIRSELRARRIEGVVHNMNSLLQILSGHAALLKRDNPQLARCDKVLDGIRRIVQFNNDLMKKHSSASCVLSAAKSALKDFNLLCFGGEERAFNFRGKTFDLRSEAAPHFEAFVLLILESAEAEVSHRVSMSGESGTVIFDGLSMPELPAGFAEGLRDVGIEILDAPWPTLRFQNVAS